LHFNRCLTTEYSETTAHCNGNFDTDNQIYVPHPKCTATFLTHCIRRWLDNQHWVRVWWRGLGNTQRQTRELVSGPYLGTKARLLSFNRTQSRAVTGLLTGHNTLRRHLYLMGLSDSPLCRGCGAKDETSAHILCECEALTSLKHVYQGSFFLEPEDTTSIRLEAIWNLVK
jgi:hypothetical protein